MGEQGRDPLLIYHLQHSLTGATPIHNKTMPMRIKNTFDHGNYARTFFM